MDSRCLARWDTMLFYRHKGTIYNAWLTGVSIPYLRTRLLLEGSQTACIECSHVHRGTARRPLYYGHHVVTQRWRSCESLSTHWCTSLNLTQSRLGNGLHLYCLTRQHTIIQVIACSLICNKNLAYNEGTRLDCYDVTSATSEFGMIIIMLGRLYFVLPCRLTPTDATPMQHGRRATVRPQTTWPGHTFYQEWARKPFGPGSLLGFWCEDTCHMVSLNPGRSGLHLPLELGVRPAFDLPPGRACS
jgi:hypothetical protein